MKSPSPAALIPKNQDQCHSVLDKEILLESFDTPTGDSWKINRKWTTDDLQQFNTHSFEVCKMGCATNRIACSLVQRNKTGLKKVCIIDH